MSIFDTMIGLLAPHSCLGCGAEGRLVCPPCEASLTSVEPRCYHCQRLSPGGLTCLRCPSILSQTQTATNYSGLAKDLIWQLKLNGVQVAARIMARHMAGFLPATNAMLVPVPTATSRARQRGYDQAKLLARELSKRSGLTYADCLARTGQSSQHGTSRQQRLDQIQNAFRARGNSLIKGAHIVLVDDVITTGATLESAAQTLKAAGATKIEAVTFARPD